MGFCAGGVSRDVVSDLVTQHGSKLRFRAEVIQQAAVDINVTATRGERIHLIVIEDEKLEVPVGDRCLGRNPCPYALDIVLYGLIFIEAVELDDLEMDPPRLLL